MNRFDSGELLLLLVVIVLTLVAVGTIVRMVMVAPHT